MTWPSALIMMCFINIAFAINKPVFKILLTQNGFAQFLQYDVEIPPLREFTFCTWIRINDLQFDQTILSYVVNGNNRIIRLWLESGGRKIKISFYDKASSSAPVDITVGTWRHVCLSYQSDYGAWALYLDSRLVVCEAEHDLYGYVIPGSGSIIVGYGTADNGTPNGLEGEVFGASMILKSTIEKNYTTKSYPYTEQKGFQRNKIRGINNIEYVVLKDLQTDEVLQNVEKAVFPSHNKYKTSHITVKTPHAVVDHEVGLNLVPLKTSFQDTSDEKEILDVIAKSQESHDRGKTKMEFWDLVNLKGMNGKFKTTRPSEQSDAGTKDLPRILEYETPPPRPVQPSSIFDADDSIENKLREEKPPPLVPLKPKDNIHNNVYNKRDMNEISEYELPPRPPTDDNVYGQWTSSKFAGNVLNYLKSINFRYPEKRVPHTIPLTKVSDNLPYASDIKINIVRPPIHLKRKNMFIEKRIHAQTSYKRPSSSSRHINIRKRDTHNTPQINIQILEDDMRTEILKGHSKVHARNVHVTFRGERMKDREHRSYRNVDNHVIAVKHNITTAKPKPFTTAPLSESLKNIDVWASMDFHKSNSLLQALPFLKSVEYFTEENDNISTEKLKTKNEMYSESFSTANKWHNVKAYQNNDDFKVFKNNQKKDKRTNHNQPDESNTKHHAIRLKYKADTNMVVPNTDDATMNKARELAVKVSKQSDKNKNNISLIKYNHGYLPGHFNMSNKLPLSAKLHRYESNTDKVEHILNDFNKPIKIGNALNEKQVIGSGEDLKRKSFIGGNERIPDINRYRSDIDNDTDIVPGSLQPRVCKNVDTILYVQADESIDRTQIVSPIKKKNVAIEFVVQTYRKCSIEDSSFAKYYLLLLQWSKTPVRLFGGAIPKKTTDLCGFF